MTPVWQQLASDELRATVQLLETPRRKVVVLCAVTEDGDACVTRRASTTITKGEARALLDALDQERERIAAIIEDSRP